MVLKMVSKRVRGLTAALVLSGASMVSHEARAGQHPIEGANLVETIVQQGNHYSIDYSNIFMGAKLAPTDGLDIVTDMDFSQNSEGMQLDGHLDLKQDESEHSGGFGFQQSFSSKTETTSVRYDPKTGSAFLGISSSVNSQEVTKATQENPDKNLSSTSTGFQLRVRTDEQLRKVQDWLLASMNEVGPGDVSRLLFDLFERTNTSPLMHNLVKEAGQKPSYLLSPKQLADMKAAFNKTGTISIPTVNTSTRPPLVGGRGA